MKKMLLGIMIPSIFGVANALETVTGHVTLLEPTYLPTAIAFYIDAGTASCESGQIIWANPNESNNKAVYATLMLALSSGRKIRLYFNDGDKTCQAKYLHLLTDQ